MRLNFFIEKIKSMLDAQTVLLTKKFLLSKIFHWQNFLLTKTSFDENIFTEKVFNPKKFLTQKSFWQKKNFDKKKFTKIFFTKNLSLQKNVYYQKFILPKCFWPKLFLTKIFLTIKRDPWGNFIILWAASATFESSLLLDVT